MSEYSDLAGKRDYTTPLPWTGKPYVKTYYDWLRREYRTDVLILIGAREEAPGVPWAERVENHGKGRQPKLPRADLSPQGQRQATHARPGPKPSARVTGVRRRIREYLSKHGDATNAEIYAALPDCKPESIRAMLHNDRMIQRTNGGEGKGSGRRPLGEESRWRLRPEAVRHE